MSEEPTQPHADDAAALSDIAAVLRVLATRFDNLENTVGDLNSTVAPLGTRLQSLEDNVGARLKILEDNFGGRLQNLEDKFDARSRDTQPMSERIDQIFSEVAATRHELREVNRTLRRMNVDLATALRNQDDLEDRVTALETSRPQ
jgi:chromosome segregation ATPase